MADAREEARKRLAARRKQIETRQTEGPSSQAREEAQARLAERRAAMGREEPHEAKSLLGQAGDLVGAIPRGLAGMAAGLVREVAQNRPNALGVQTGPHEFGGKKIERRDGETEAEFANRARPFTAPAVESFSRSAGHVVQGAASLKPGGLKPSETDYAKASKEGRILAVLLEDLGNLSLVGYGAGRALGVAGRGAEAAGAARTASRLTGAAEKVTGAARAADVAAGAPARVFTEPVRLVAKGAKAANRRFGVTSKVAERVASSEMGSDLKAALEHRRERAAQIREVRDTILEPTAQETQLAYRRHQLLTEAAERTLKDPEARHANHLIHQGFRDVVAKIRSVPEGPLRDQVVREVFGPEQAPTQRTLQIAEDYTAGRLPAAERKAMDDAYAFESKMSTMHEEQALAGEGRFSRGPLSEEQVSDAPMQSKIDEKMRARNDKAEEIERELYGTADRPGGLADRAMRARARVGEVDLSKQVPRRGVQRIERAATLEERQRLGSEQAQRFGRRAEEAESVRARLEDRALPGESPDLGRVTGRTERAAGRAKVAGGAAEEATARGEGARGRIFAEGARNVPEDAAGTLFDPANRARRRPEDISPEVAERELQEFDEQIRVGAARGYEDAISEMADMFETTRLAWKPTQRLAGQRDRRLGAGMHVDDTGAEWDWFRTLHPAEQARIRGRWMVRPGEDGGMAPDVLASTLADKLGHDVTVEEATALFLRYTREIEALSRIAAGKGLLQGDLDAAVYRLGLDEEQARAALVERPAAKAGGDPRPRQAGNGPKQRLAARTAKYGEYLRRNAERDAIGPEPPVARPGRPSAWEMPRAEYVAEVESLTDVLAAADERLSTLDEWADYTPEERAAFDRLQELNPAGFGDETTTFDELHGLLADAARHYGHEVPDVEAVPAPPTREEVRQAVGDDAVATATADALEAVEADIAMRAAYREMGRPVPKEALAYTHLDARQKVLYRQVTADARRTTAEQALANARRTLVDRLRGEGERFGRRAGAAGARARVFGEEAARAERTAAGAERALASRTVERVEALSDAERRSVEAELGLAPERALARPEDAQSVVGRLVSEEQPGLRQRAEGEIEQGMARGVRAGERRGRADQRARALETSVAGKERRLARIREQVAAEERRLAAGPQEVAPGKYRPALLAAGRLREAATRMAEEAVDKGGDRETIALLRTLADDVATTMADLHERGILPEYLIGGADRTPGMNMGGGAGRGRLPRIGRLKGETAKQEGRVLRSTRSVGYEYAKEAADVLRNKAADQLATRFGRAGGSMILQQIDELPEGSTTRANLEYALEHGGDDLAKELHRQGWTAWNPEGKPGSQRVHEDAVTAETLFLPTSLMREFESWNKPPYKGALARYRTEAHPHYTWMSFAVDAYDIPTRGWKHMQLALSPAWNVGNAISNVLMAKVAGGLSFAELGKFGTEALHTLREESRTGEVHLPPRLYNAGMGAEALRFFADDAPERTGRLGRTINASYRLNGFIDDWGRSTVYLANTAKGMSKEVAVREALKAMGDFGRLSSFQREVIRRIFPFFTWARHVTQMSAHLAVEHPFRVAWTLHLANLYAPELPEGSPDFLHGAIPLGGDRYLNLGILNPFDDLQGGPFTSPTGALRAMNPLLRFAFGAGLGVNTAKGRVFTRPPGTEPRDSYGNERLGPLSPKQAVYFLLQQTPQTRAGYAAVADPVVRYDTGDPMKRKGQTIPIDESKAAAVPRAAGIPFIPMKVDVEAAARRKRQRDIEAQRSRRRYFGG